MFWTWAFILFMGASVALLVLIALAWGYKNAPGHPDRAEKIEAQAKEFEDEVITPKVEKAVDALSRRVKKMRGEDDEEMVKLEQEEARALQELDDIEGGRSSQERIDRMEAELVRLRKEMGR